MAKRDFSNFLSSQLVKDYQKLMGAINNAQTTDLKAELIENYLLDHGIDENDILFDEKLLAHYSQFFYFIHVYADATVGPDFPEDRVVLAKNMRDVFIGSVLSDDDNKTTLYDLHCQIFESLKKEYPQPTVHSSQLSEVEKTQYQFNAAMEELITDFQTDIDLAQKNEKNIPFYEAFANSIIAIDLGRRSFQAETYFLTPTDFKLDPDHVEDYLAFAKHLDNTAKEKACKRNATKMFAIAGLALVGVILTALAAAFTGGLPILALTVACFALMMVSSSFGVAIRSDRTSNKMHKAHLFAQKHEGTVKGKGTKKVIYTYKPYGLN